jgi:ATP-dependent protease HslVU (ClpYQ) peptidase subunit
MSIGTSLKGIFYNLATNLMNASYIQIVASLAVSITVATTLLDKFDEFLEEAQGDFNDLKTLEFSHYLMAFIDLSKLDVAIVNILTAITFALVWRFTYDLKPKSKISN